MDIKTMVKLYKELIVEKIQKSEKKYFGKFAINLLR